MCVPFKKQGRTQCNNVMQDDSPHATFKNSSPAVITVVLSVAARVVMLILEAIAGTCHLHTGTQAIHNHMQTPCTVAEINAQRIFPDPAHMMHIRLFGNCHKNVFLILVTCHFEEVKSNVSKHVITVPATLL